MLNCTDFSERNFWGYATSLGASAADESMMAQSLAASLRNYYQ
jgi:hypothetical protein